VHLLIPLNLAPFCDIFTFPNRRWQARHRARDKDGATVDTISDETWRAPAEKYFKGEIIVAKDLMVV
jgi:hypothetical protein